MLNLNVRMSVRSRMPLAAMLLAASMAASQAFAQGTTGPNQKSFQEFEMNATEGIINRPLPFDVPFIVTGRVPADVLFVRAYLAKPPVPVFPPANPQPVRRISCEGIPWTEDNVVGVWTAPPPALVTTPAATPRFRILFPPLEVNTNYCTRLEFQRVVTAAEADAFRRSAFTAIDQELRAVQFRDRNFTNDDVENLRQRLIAAVRGTNSAIYASSGTIFDDRATGAARTNAQRELVTRITPALEPQFQGYLQIGAYERFVKSATASLDALRKAAAAPASLLRRQAFVDTLSDGDESTLKQLLDGTSDAVTAFVGGGDTLTSIWEVQSAQPCIVPQVDPLLSTLRTNADFLFRLTQALQQASAVAADKVEADGLVTLLAGTNGSGPAMGAALLAIEGATVPAAPGGAIVRTAGIRDTACARALAINAVALTLRTVARDEVTLIVTTTGDFASRHAWHFSVDVGLAVAPVIGEIFPYVGVNIYFRPVNRDAKLSSLSEAYGRPVSTFTRRFSLMLGYTWTDNLLQTNRRLGLFNTGQVIGQSVEDEPADSMLVAGAGLRINDVLRIAGGALVFKSANTNPLFRDTDLKVTPFFSMSWDWDAVGNVRGLGGLMGFGNSPIPVAVTQRDPPPAPPAPTPAASPAPAPAAPAPAPAPAPAAPAPAPAAPAVAPAPPAPGA